MRFSANSKKWCSGVLAVCLALPVVGCSPEASSSGTKPVTGTSGMSTKPKEQTGSSTSGSAPKGREVDEPSPPVKEGDDKPASEKPKE